MRIPKTIRLDGVTYQVKIVAPQTIPGCWGEAHQDKAVIKISKALAHDMRWQVLLHEVLHLIFAHAGIKLHHKREESIVDRVDALLYGFLRNNGILPRRKKK